MSLVKELSLFESKELKNTSRYFDNTDHKIILHGKNLFEKHAVIAGPCAIESKEQINTIAKFLKKEEIDLLRGGAYKPRTSPYAFQGLGEEGLDLLKQAGLANNLPVISEVVSIENFDTVEAAVDVIQVGARNMYNYSLLKRAGRSNKPVLLKRSFSATLKEFLMAAEYIIHEGNPNVILCERGVRHFDQMTRNLLDLASITLLKKFCRLPIMVDPSHGCGHPFLVKPMTMAAYHAGSDGVMIEVHNEPEKALCDGYQSLDFETFSELKRSMNNL